MRLFFIYSILFFIPQYAFAAFIVTGKVTNIETNMPVAGAAIKINNTTVGTTDLNGDYEIRTELSQLISITFIAEGYETKVVQVLLTHDLVLNVSLHVRYENNQLIHLNEVNIQEQRLHAKSTFAYQYITAKELQQLNQGQDIPYILQWTPSITQSSDAGNGVGYTTMRMRGTDASRIQITINNVPINDAESQAMYWVDLPDIVASAHDIEVQRGVGTSTNGAAAFGGSVHINTIKWNSKPTLQYEASIGSFATQRHSIISSSGIWHKYFNIDARLSWIKSDGYIDRASSNLHSYYLSTNYRKNKHRLSLIHFSGNEKSYQSWYGVPHYLLDSLPTYNPAGGYTDDNGFIQYYDNQADHYKQDYYQLVYRNAINTNLQFNTTIYATKGKGYYEEYKESQDAVDYNLSDTTIITDVIRQKHLDNILKGVTTDIVWHSKNTKFIIGGNANVYKGKHFGLATGNYKQDILYYENNANKDDISAYIKCEQYYNTTWMLYIDAQIRNVNYRYRPAIIIPPLSYTTVRYNFINPKLGISKKINNATVYISYARAQREPNRDDHVNNISGGNPKSESLHDIELGWRMGNEKSKAELNVYFMEYKNQLILTGKINEVGEYTRTNVAKSYRRGVEFIYQLPIFKNILLDIASTYSINKIKSYTHYTDNYDTGMQEITTYSNRTIAFSPNMISKARLNFHVLDHLLFQLGGQFISKQYLDNTNDPNSILPEYISTDALVSYRSYGSIIKEWNIILRANNLLNQSIVSNGYTYSFIADNKLQYANSFFPQASRNFTFSIMIKI